jgi:peptidoglycan/LPS O-acetylase OafA/YrhL
VSQVEQYVGGNHSAIDLSVLPINLEYSGHWFNDLGDWQDCVANSSLHYLLADFDGLLTGICMEYVCSAGDLNYIINQTSSVAAASLTIKDPLTARTFDMGPAFYFTIVLLSFLGLLVVSGTISAFLRDEKTKNEIRESLSLKASLATTGLSQSTMTVPQGDSLIGPGLHNTKSLGPYSDPRRVPFIIKLIECWDIRAAFKKAFATEAGGEGFDRNLLIFNGVRALSFWWVIFGHSYLEHAAFTPNPQDIGNFMDSTFLLVISGGLYAVDVFFYLSGFFVAYVCIDKLKKMTVGPLTYVKLFVHRMLRIWPAYFIAILVYWQIVPLLGSGPIWYNYIGASGACNGTSWKNLLFIDDFTNTNGFDSYCFGWGWYLSNDTQMFLLVPFIIWAYNHNKALGKIIAATLIFLGVGTACLTAVLTDYPFNYAEGEITTNAQTQWFYVFPGARCPPYYLGVLMAFYYKEWKVRGNENTLFGILKKFPITRIIVFLVGWGIINFLIFFPRTGQDGTVYWNGAFGYIWQGTSRIVFCMALAAVLAPSLVGEFRLVTGILNNYFMAILAKLSYSGYLVHLIFILAFIFSAESMLFLNNSNFIAFALWVLVCTTVAALSLMLIVEIPMMYVETRILFPRAKSDPRKEKSANIVSQKTPLLKDEEGLINRTPDTASEK